MLSRSNTWVAPAWTSGPRPSPVTHSTPSTPSAASPAISWESTTRLRSRQVSVIHGRAPTSRSSAASSVGGKPGERAMSPTSTVSDTAPTVRATSRSVGRSNAGTLRSVMTTGRWRASASSDPAAGSARDAAGSGQDRRSTGSAGSAQGHGSAASTSHDPSERTPPHGPNTIRFGQRSTGPASRDASEPPIMAVGSRRPPAPKRRSSLRTRGVRDEGVRAGRDRGLERAVPVPEPEARRPGSGRRDARRARALDGHARTGAGPGRLAVEDRAQARFLGQADEGADA